MEGQNKEVGRSKCRRESQRIEHETWLNTKTERLQPLVNSVPTSNRYFIVRESGEPLKMRKQKIALEAGALIDDAKKWKSTDFKPIRRQVRRLQVRIAKAVKDKRWNKVKVLQYLLTRSFYAKLLAVKRVTSYQPCQPVNIGHWLYRKINGRIVQQVQSFKMLEPCDGKLSCTVLRGERS